METMNKLVVFVLVLIAAGSCSEEVLLSPNQEVPISKKEKPMEDGSHRRSGWVLLDRDSRLMIRRSSSYVTFKKNTYAYFDNEGKIWQGTLKSDTRLLPSGSTEDFSERITFKAGTEVLFESRQGGRVKRGTLRYDVNLAPSGAPKANTHAYKIVFKAGTEVVYATGQENRVLEGTLKNDRRLFVSGASSDSSPVTFKAGTRVYFEFRQRVAVKRGVLKNDSNLLPNGYTDFFSRRIFKAGSEVVFTTGQKEKVSSGILKSRSFFKPPGSNSGFYVPAGPVVTFDRFGGAQF